MPNERVSDELVEKLAVSIFDMDSDNDTVPWERQPGRVRTRTRRTVRSVLSAISIHAPELQQRRASVVTDEMVDRACSATVLGEDADGKPVHLEPDEARTALTAALSVSHETGDGETQAVAVKPLEWIEYPNTHSPDVFGHFWDAETPFVRYTIEEVSGPDFESETPHYEVNRGRDCLICTKLTLLEAKAAAQDDYEQRIRYALTPTDETKGVKRDDEGRLPTREEAAHAAAVLIRCNGHDLDVWTDGEWPSNTDFLDTLVHNHDQ